MRQTRHNVFETNSSSTHSLVMAMASDFDKWVNGEVYYCENAWDARKAGFEQGKFYSKERVVSYYNDKNKERNTDEFCTYEEFIDDGDNIETSSYSYTTPNGEVIKVVAKYGYDG